MNLLKVTLKDCYGIGEFDHSFDFSLPATGDSRHKKTCTIYAHNGIMKTSFAKTLDDIAQGRLPIDYVSRRDPDVSIEVDGSPIDPDSIYVVHSQSDYFESDKMMTLLADQATQERYVEIMTIINTALNALFENTASKLGVTGSDKVDKVKKLFDEQFKSTDENRLTNLISMKPEVVSANPDLLRVSYKVLNDTKVTTFLDERSTHDMLNDYVTTYEALVAKSKYFSSELYDYNNAADVQKSMKKNNFMKAKNRVILVDKEGAEVEVDTPEKLAELYEADKAAVFESLELKQKYEKFDTKIGANESMRGFRDWVKANQDFIAFLRNYKGLKQRTWHAYFADSGELYTNLIEQYEAHKDELSAIYDKSEALESEWQEVVDKFNDSFVVPFTVAIKNKKDVVLNRNKPELEFSFKDDRSGGPKPIHIDVLTGTQSAVLSKGESRALYILCIMFEIESRRKDGKDHLIIFDDVADSFDYKNKYAIIEYIHGLSEDFNNGMHLIVMTHNFDFFRALRLRCSSHYENAVGAKIAVRSGRGIITLNPAGSTDEFKRLKTNVRSDPKIFISLIPFARNLTEHSRGATDSHYLKLTSCLHIKSDTPSIVTNEIVSAMSSVVGGVNLSAYATADNYRTVLDREVKDVLSHGNEMLIEHKIVLSIAIRLSVEEYIQKRFTAVGSPLAYDTRQTGKWYSEFLKAFAGDSAVSVLNRAMITTPESIHFNSFMYEPIMDLSLDDLKKLYIDIKAL